MKSARLEGMAMSKTREKFPLSPKKIIKKTLGATIAWIFVIGFFGAFLSLVVGAALNEKGMGWGFVGILNLGILSLLAVITLVNYLYQKWYFDFYYYELGDDYIIIRKGPITPKEITIPYERIQDVYVDQDLLDRIFGLYDVHLSSATISSGMEAHIDGVAKPAADGLREMLLKTVGERISKKKT